MGYHNRLYLKKKMFLHQVKIHTVTVKFSQIDIDKVNLSSGCPYSYFFTPIKLCYNIKDHHQPVCCNPSGFKAVLRRPFQMFLASTPLGLRARASYVIGRYTKFSTHEFVFPNDCLRLRPAHPGTY